MTTDENELRRELEAIYRKLFTLWQENRVRIIEMPDDEYVRRIEAKWEETAPESSLIFGFNREKVYQYKRALKPETLRFLEVLVQDKVEAAFPFLLENRQLARTTGPVTELEARIASLSSSVVYLNESISRIRDIPDRRRCDDEQLRDLEVELAEIEALRRNPTQANFDHLYRTRKASPSPIREFDGRDGVDP